MFRKYINTDDLGMPMVDMEFDTDLQCDEQGSINHSIYGMLHNRVENMKETPITERINYLVPRSYDASNNYVLRLKLVDKDADIPYILGLQCA